MLNCLKFQSNGGLHLSWRWWPLTMLSKNHLESMLFHWSRKWVRVPTYTMKEDDASEVEDSSTSGMPSHMALFLLRIRRTSKIHDQMIPAFPTALRCFNVGLLCLGYITRIWCKSLWGIKLEPNLDMALPNQ